MVVTVVTYKLRGGQIQPRLNCGGSCACAGTPTFYMQTFGAEKTVSDIYDAKTTLLASTDFQGQKPTTSPLGIEDPAYIAQTFSRATYQGRALRTTDGELVYSATEEHVSEFMDEDLIGTG